MRPPFAVVGHGADLLALEANRGEPFQSRVWVWLCGHCRCKHGSWWSWSPSPSHSSPASSSSSSSSSSSAHSYSTLNKYTGYAECYLVSLYQASLRALWISLVAPVRAMAWCPSPQAEAGALDASGDPLPLSPFCESSLLVMRVTSSVLEVVLLSPASYVHKLYLALNGAAFAAYKAVLLATLPGEVAAAMMPAAVGAAGQAQAGGNPWDASPGRSSGGFDDASAPGAAQPGALYVLGSLSSLVMGGLYGGAMLAGVWDVVQYANVAWLAVACLGGTVRTVASGVLAMSKAVSERTPLAAVVALAWLPMVVAAGNAALFLVLLTLPALSLGLMAQVPAVVVGILVGPSLWAGQLSTSLMWAVSTLGMWLVARLVKEAHLGTARLFFMVYFDSTLVADESVLVHALALVAFRVLLTPIDRAGLRGVAAILEWQSLLDLLDDYTYYSTPRESRKPVANGIGTATVTMPPSSARKQRAALVASNKWSSGNKARRAPQRHLPPPPPPPILSPIAPRAPTPRGFSTSVEAADPLDDERVTSFVAYADSDDDETTLDRRLDAELVKRLGLPPPARPLSSRPGTDRRRPSRSVSVLGSVARSVARSVSVALARVDDVVRAVDESRPNLRSPPPVSARPAVLRRSLRLSAKKGA
ncbi:uncharacterized protein AMSG_08269 [Thecamonas trahens ATCC 50062]|uniref:Transmembrane protein n=1 Tax=Thecamonas trahens ATCC 50062 TaxID=461836 RepID=A0A0L0DIT2_THETB|nr:hypothetical protein AMSG_08269 [Thecamonas trahens ATCC 50062]KNC52016.1 hypothetical protein AMSG_08269 [Thecamonas trahens ATCC 50062]|eukprot:XP_013755599.1 hypothetical protein AMSG_08269 [Thecamonas trahens ATCC 50062]